MKTRYPGVSPFTSKQQNIFYGRDKDIKKLQKLISLRNQVLVYAKSGIGKTSILNAGVLPLLEKKYSIFKIRFTAYDNKNSISPVENIINLLKTKFQPEDKTTFLDQIEQNSDYNKTLWHYFKQYNLLQNDNEDFILVFDQFEELFSYPEQEIQEFKNQMHDLINDNLPNSVKQFIAEHPEIEDQTEVLYDDLNIKTVFAIRSDRLSLINKLTDKLPDIQKNFYELNSLDNEQAKLAIVNPANDKADFETKAFEFEKTALDTIINALSDNGKQNIETTQLQIICERIENIAQEKYKNSLNNEIVQITNVDLPRFDDIFLDFYDKSINKVAKQLSEKNNVQKFVEDQLIRNHQRISLDEIICIDYVSKEILKELVNSHLLRAERNSTGGFSYELSHDTLIEPILISRKKRIEKEEEQKAEQERIEELRIAQETAEQERIERKKEQKRQRTIIAIVTVAAIVSIVFGAFGFWQMQKAKANLSNAIKFQVLGKKKDAISFKNQEIYNSAIGKYEELLSIYREYPKYNFDTLAVYKDINECELLSVESETFHLFMTKADSLIEKKDLESIKKSYNYYIKADSLDYPFNDKTFEKYNIKFHLAIDNLKSQKKSAKETGGEYGKIIAVEIDDFLNMIDN